ncbi:MAG: chorismate synthase [Saprospiraceae bacterium]|nr:chorismate synthase [Saprospiraceae bacterium]
MAGNIFGNIFRITTYGESHGKGIGVVIDGCPAGLFIDIAFIQKELDRRRPGQSDIVTQRNEDDRVQILSGVYGDISLGSPIHLFVPNKDARSGDYHHLSDAFRPSHADYTYTQKYGLRDVNGGGRSSARETIARVAAGAVAKLLLQKYQISVDAYVSQVGTIRIPEGEHVDYTLTESNIVRCPHQGTAEKMINYISEIKAAGDSVGGIISCCIQHCPVGLGEPVFDKLHADLAKAMLSINAVKGFEIGSGFEGVTMLGSLHNDIFEKTNQGIQTKTNHSGGIQGGISNGMPITFRVAFKPVSTIMKDQQSITQDGDLITLEGKGRHDPCVVPRAVPIVESMAALVIADHLLRNVNSKI